MENTVKIVLTIIALTLAGCSVTKTAQPGDEFGLDHAITERMRDALLGRWCGEKIYSDGTVQRWTVLRLRDGAYKVDFYTIDADGKEERWGEYGLWGVRAPIYFTAMRGFIKEARAREADTTNALFYDAYKVVELNEEVFTYKSYTSGNTFTLTRECGEGI
ncbi:MAG TPA: hypothetical protein DIW43_05075 [Spongiibacteraceae bacterium]|nr:hypothetical protein [Spongiibacteraceae bacterium]HCS26800.1 hypothetical protein [Spongiibacteraceae bacterium]|tara:strand:- start:405 stop:887 length:483 start_codon:yes stop_codon:yes gene_type:complete